MIRFRLVLIGLLICLADGKREIPVGEYSVNCLRLIGNGNRTLLAGKRLICGLITRRKMAPFKLVAVRLDFIVENCLLRFFLTGNHKLCSVKSTFDRGNCIYQVKIIDRMPVAIFCSEKCARTANPRKETK